MSEETISEEQVLHNKLKFEINQELIHLMNRILELQQENSQLKEDIKGFEQERQTLYNTIHDLQKANKKLDRKIEKAIKNIEKDTRWFDSEYACMYGTLCSCAGAKDDRLEVMVNSSNLLEILKGDKE